VEAAPLSSALWASLGRHPRGDRECPRPHPAPLADWPPKERASPCAASPSTEGEGGAGGHPPQTRIFCALPKPATWVSWPLTRGDSGLRVSVVWGGCPPVPPVSSTRWRWRDCADRRV